VQIRTLIVGNAIGRGQRRTLEMGEASDVLVAGTGSFAGRIVFDIAATARSPVRVVVAGRNRERLNWLAVAANARAAIFHRAATFRTVEIDFLAPDAAARLIAATSPKVVVQAASVQTSAVIAKTGDGWSKLVAEGGLSATAVSHSLISSRVAAAITASGKPIDLINCCFPDVVNGIIKALGHEVVSGMGNIAILSSVFAGARGLAEPGRIKVLAHYQNIAAFRRRPDERSGTPPRVWIDGAEIADVYAEFADVRLTLEPAIDISGASGVPLALALADRTDWVGHVPGPHGLPGGYPVRLQDRQLTLDLPAGVTAEDAVAWNAAFEQNSGLLVDAEGNARYTGRLQASLREHSPTLAGGFQVQDLESVYLEMLRLREMLEVRH
jgi:hypothetical protein